MQIPKKLPQYSHAATLAVLLLFCFSISSTLFAQAPSRPRNLDLLDSLMRTASERAVKQLRTPLFPQDTLHIVIAPHEGAWMLENALFAHLRKAKRYRSVDSAAFRAKLMVRLTDCAVRYFSCVNAFDSLAREASCALEAHVETSDGVIQPLKSITVQLRDTISRQAVPSLESKQYAFASPAVPDAAPNVWKQIIEPAVVILAGVLIVALFFFVRTQ
jgi:hypothetical protein